MTKRVTSVYSERCTVLQTVHKLETFLLTQLSAFKPARSDRLGTTQAGMQAWGWGSQHDLGLRMICTRLPQIEHGCILPGAASVMLETVLDMARLMLQ